jgi:hypothetical protein
MCDHYFQYAWRGTTASGYWIQKCQRCGMEKCVESEEDYYTGSQLDNAVIEYTIVNQTGRERFTELEAERDALLAEVAELQIYRDCVSRACRRYSALDEDSNLVIPDGAKALVILFRERDALREELAERDARRCQTCKKWYPFGCWIRNEILEDRGQPAGEQDDIYCSEWEPKEE